MSANFSNVLLKIGVALAKHHAKNLIGDEALEVIATTATDIGGEKLQEQINDILASREGEKELLEAAKSADENFRARCKDNDFRELFTMSHGDLTSVQNAIAGLPKDFSEESLKNILFDVFRAELPKRVGINQINDGIALYITCLHDALLPVKEFGIRILYSEIKEMGKDIKDIKAATQLLVKSNADIARAFVSLPGLYITPSLIAPYEKTTSEVVVGKTISIDHIRDQRFMLRKEILVDALNELDAFLSKHLNNFDPEILTFWISGRSGSGKSVLLLQIMQEIVITRNAKVIWLDDAADKLPVLLEKWVEQEDVRETLFVFVDDFNSPQVRDRIDYRGISQLLRNPKYHKVTWPVLVTCSPPEYLEEFQKTGGTEYFQVKKWGIPSVSKLEQKYFLEWFSIRTGEVANPGLAFEQDNGLVLSMMLELRHGNIIEFARRFKERLAGSNILEQMTLLLALNRLYIWAPATWLSELTPEQQDGLQALNLDQDFSVLNIENSEKKLIRLTHPHLSDAIYKAIRPESFGNQRTDDLARAFEKVVATDDVLASRILLVIAQGGDRITLDLNEKTLAEKIVVHCRTLLEIVNKFHPINLAFVWVNLAKWASREPHVDKVLSTPALDTAIQALGNDHYSWGDLWLQLWACYPDDKRLSESGWLWTKNYFHWDETAWYVIWDILLSKPDMLPDNVNKADVLEVGVLWLSGREDHRWWSRVWQSVLKNETSISSNMPAFKIIRIGTEWLNGREDSGQWSFVWEDILQYAQNHKLANIVDEMLNYGIDWLAGREDQLQWAFVWQGILKYHKYASYSVDTAKVLNIGVNWIVTKEDSYQWNYMWDWVTNNLDKSSSATKKILITWGLSWIITNQKRKKWPIVYIDLAKMKYRQEFKKIISVKDFITLGVEWSEEHKDDDEAGQVVLYLLRSYQTNLQRPDLPLQDMKLYNRLVDLTNLMVRKTPMNSPALPFWLLCYLEIKPAIQTVHAILKWMEIVNEDSEGTRSIINKLMADQRPDVLNVLIKWQQEHPHNLISGIIKSKLEKEIPV